MLFLFSGSDREKAREALNAAVEKTAGLQKGTFRITFRITDAHTIDDLRTALRGPGMFPPAGGPEGGARVVVLDGILSGGNEEAQAVLLGALKDIRDSAEVFFMLEGALDASTRKQVEKYAEKSERFDAKKAEAEKTIFALANALQRGDKRGLWLGLMREFGKGSAPEAVHGLLFWGAKQGLLRARGEEEAARMRRLVAALAELPHRSRRKGEELSYALERFALSSI